MSVESPFQPQRGAGQKVTASTTSAAITIGRGCKSIRAVNAGTVLAYFVTYRAADGAVTASATQAALAPGASAIFEKDVDHDMLAYVADSGTPVLHFQSGEGGW